MAPSRAGNTLAPPPPAEHPVPRPAPDAAPDWVAAGTPAPLAAALRGALGEDGAGTRALDLIRYASDASPYRLIPRAVAIPRDLAEVGAVMRVARETGTPLVFRAGGTSLNGQSQTDGILLDCRRHFKDVHVEADGDRVRTQPGAVLGHVNRILARHGRRLGPDPASTEIACVGGVLANNSGGMRCGVHADSYRTVRSLRFLLADGTEIDTAAAGAEERFAAAAPELARGLAEIRDELRADAELAARVARKFEIKNTTGYRLCAFLDADEPLEIFRRLLIGSEGTLGFIGEAVFDTVPLGRHTSLSLSFFESIDAAVASVPELVAAGAIGDGADGRADADRGRVEHARHARALEGAAPRLGRAARRVPRRSRGRARRARAARRSRSSAPARRSRSRPSRASAGRSRCCGTSARACRACSRRCAARA